MARTIIIANANQLARKRAMLTALTAQDRYRAGGDWYGVEEGWQHGRAVEEVSHFGRHATAIGDTLNVEGDDGKRYGQVQVERIVMVDSGDLVDDEIAALGYDSRAAFSAREPGYVNRRAWMVYIRPISTWWRFWERGAK